MFASYVASGRSGVFPGDRCVGTVIGGADLVQDLVGRVYDIGPEGEVLGQCELHSELVQRG